MKKAILTLLAIAIIFLTFLSMTSPNELVIGDTIPSFTLQDQNGIQFNIDDFRGKSLIVIYFYPKDDTPGCTKEACTFRDSYESFSDLGVKVIGISADDVHSHKNFADKYNLPFTLLSDLNNEVRKQFGVPKSLLGILPGRVTYIINKHGIISHIFNSQFNPTKHIEKSLEVIKKLKEEE